MPGCCALLDKNGGLKAMHLASPGRAFPLKFRRASVKLLQCCPDNARFVELAKIGAELAKMMRVEDFFPDEGLKGPLCDLDPEVVISITEINGVNPSLAEMLSVKSSCPKLQALCQGPNEKAMTMMDKKHKNWKVFGNALLISYSSQIVKSEPGNHLMCHEYRNISQETVKTLRSLFPTLKLDHELQQLASPSPLETPPKSPSTRIQQPPRKQQEQQPKEKQCWKLPTEPVVMPIESIPPGPPPLIPPPPPLGLPPKSSSKKKPEPAETEVNISALTESTPQCKPNVEEKESPGDKGGNKDTCLDLPPPLGAMFQFIYNGPPDEFERNLKLVQRLGFVLK